MYAMLDISSCLDREHSMKLVQQHCSKYLTMFGECVHQFPHTWQMDCEPERRKLARCAETNPEILHIKSVCAAQFSVYEQCMNENRSDADKCTESFLDFTSCAQEALGTYKNKSPVVATQVSQTILHENEKSANPPDSLPAS
ncbi:coiled-coil-helix-coiled-coil-helix domain-containing 5 [Elysia marginata]|uniref:Coiled-coil-helix-coiled-coil-helix domain-containing 5 n=1 Tax=Elysia marginata TaxID=1093978 RepID=A0AAV4JRB4_9GAST|nr:coiled-coil-helix-coiled-coil-helix domain-containing 5 [Elysia marginata]